MPGHLRIYFEGYTYTNTSRVKIYKMNGTEDGTFYIEGTGNVSNAVQYELHSKISDYMPDEHLIVSGAISPFTDLTSFKRELG